MKRALIIFAKNPIKGKVKTRLASTMGDDFAFDTYLQLLKHTQNCTNHINADKMVFYSDTVEHNDGWDDLVYTKNIQSGNDLGEKMFNAFDNTFKNNYDQVVLIGSDCFEITHEIIEQAFESLNKNNVVFGPAMDGGYYLLGQKANHSALFNKIDWSTDRVLRQSLARCTELELNIAQLEQLSDIDNEADFKRWADRLQNSR